MNMPVSPPVVCLMGPTASGKSAACLAIAARWPIEIVNVDSATIYRGMDIGTAKPSPAEQAQVPQHLLDILDPAESYSAGQFRTDTLRLIDEIRARGRIPLLAGGTMMYFKTLRDGLDDLPLGDPDVRAAIDARAAARGWASVHAELARIDPPTAARLSPNDAQRIQRALEICTLAGQPMSTLIGRKPKPAEHRYVNLCLEPSDRSGLHRRIAQRFDAMLDAGLLDEVRALHARGDLHEDMASIRCVGYRQAWAHIEGRIDFQTMREQGLAATRQLGKRQVTWLRALDERETIDCLAPDAQAQVVDAFARAQAG
jgi:tRNA dimethylallyltransferase